MASELKSSDHRMPCCLATDTENVAISIVSLMGRRIVDWLAEGKESVAVTIVPLIGERIVDNLCRLALAADNVVVSAVHR